MRQPRLPEDVLAYFRYEGAKGGTKVAQAMTAAERRARATKASHAAARARTTQTTKTPRKKAQK